MSADERLASDRFPRSAKYHPDWILAGASGGANPLWLVEWLCEALALRPGQRVLDLGCGRALSSIFLHREFGVQVWATDLWFSASENVRRIREAGAQAGVFPLRADARSLPFPDDFFDAVVSIDSFMYFGTDDFYLNSLGRLVRPGGVVGIAQAGLMHELDDPIPPHLSAWWTAEMAHGLHSADWWRRHWTRGRVLDVSVADTMPEGWRFWRAWLERVAPENETEIRALDIDAGRNFAYVRAIGHRRDDAPLFDPLLSLPAEYVSKPMLRSR